MSGFKEATIVINGRECTNGEAMTIRCAIESFSYELQSGLGDDEHGRKMTASYYAAIRALRYKMGYGTAPSMVDLNGHVV